MLRWLLILLSTLLTLPGCADTNTDASRDSARADSAGVQLVTHDASLLDVAHDAGAFPEPIVSIGALSGQPWEEFSYLAGAAFLGSDKLAVVDGGNAEVRLFDMNAGHLGSHGGRGSGPGEFEFPYLVGVFCLDSLLLYDRALRRFTVVTVDGALHPVTNLPTNFRGAPTAVAPSGEVLIQAGTARARPDSPEEIVSNDVRFSIVRGQSVSDTAASGGTLLADVPGQKVLRWKSGNRFGFTPVPYDVPPVAAAGPHGFFILRGGSGEIRHYGLNGDLVRIIRFVGAAQPVTEDQFAAFVDSVVSSAEPELQPELRRRYSLMRPPELTPLFDRLVVGQDGDLWLRRADQRTWVALDSAGGFIDSARFPPDIEVLQIRSDMILGHVTDSLDVERVQVFGLTRDGG